MRILSLALFLPLTLAGCLSFSSSSPPRQTIIVPPSSTTTVLTPGIEKIDSPSASVSMKSDASLSARNVSAGSAASLV